MSKIKFRAWVKDLNKIVDVTKIDFKEKEILFDGQDDNLYTLPDRRKFSEVEIMQYTGLKDMNGVEIFDGDKVSINHEYIALGLYQEDEYEGIIKFDGLRFVLSDYTLKHHGKRPVEIDGIDISWGEDGEDFEEDIDLIYFDIENADNCIVIGNIYEDPELLEGVKDEKLKNRC